MASANSFTVGVGSSGGGSYANGGSNHNVFVYGSLLADEVVRVLLHRIPQNSPAILHGLFSIKGRVYPAILPVENKKVTGRVLLGISAPELEILDKFEDFEYEKKAVDVSLVGAPEDDVLQAYTYVWAKSNDTNLYGDWDFEVWKASKMKDFVNMTMGFVEQESNPRVVTYESYYKPE